MSGALERSLNKAKNEGEELKHRIQGLIHTIEFSDITLKDKSVFSNEFSKLSNDVATLNEIILNTIVHDHVDLESYVIAPERISDIATCKILEVLILTLF